MASSSQAPPELLMKLQHPSPTSCYAETIDFGALGFSRGKDGFAMLIHDLLTPEECDALLHAAQSTTSGRWDPALLRGGENGDVLVTNVRLSDRIMWDDAKVADAILQRVTPHLPADITTLKDRPAITGQWDGELWKATRLNERLRFLRYKSGMYFRKHCDGNYITSDGSEVTFLTVHLYLRGSDDLQGGATRFFNSYRGTLTYDVNPAPGSCLVFQHRSLLHSGEDVIQGTKYTLRTDLLYRRVNEDTKDTKG